MVRIEGEVVFARCGDGRHLRPLRLRRHVERRRLRVAGRSGHVETFCGSHAAAAAWLNLLHRRPVSSSVVAFSTIDRCGALMKNLPEGSTPSTCVHPASRHFFWYTRIYARLRAAKIASHHLHGARRQESVGRRNTQIIKNVSKECSSQAQQIVQFSSRPGASLVQKLPERGRLLKAAVRAAG